MRETITADYLVVGAGAAGLAFVDSLLTHSDARVAVVDRRDGPGGHWRDAYPFVQLHQASEFYGVASTPLGAGIRQTSGPEAGLHERATGSEVVAYFERVAERWERTGRVQFLWRFERRDDGRLVSLDGPDVALVSPGTRVVDARYLSPLIPASTPPPFEVDPRVAVVPVGRLPEVAGAARHVVVGSGKTATDAIVWLLTHGHDPEAICWIRPRDPWMLDRARVQPEPGIFHTMVADTFEAAAKASTLETLFLSLEERGVMLRIDRDRTPTMAKAPTLGRWELELLRQVRDVVRLGRLTAVEPGMLHLIGGDVSIARDTVVLHCAADGLRRPGLTPIWSDQAVTLQPVRAGFPCFGAAIVGYVEATRPQDDVLKNSLCPPTPYGDSRADWADMTARGARATARFMAEPDIARWANGVLLNPARVPDGFGSPDLEAAQGRTSRAAPTAIDRLEALAREGV